MVLAKRPAEAETESSQSSAIKQQKSDLYRSNNSVSSNGVFGSFASSSLVSSGFSGLKTCQKVDVSEKNVIKNNLAILADPSFADFTIIFCNQTEAKVHKAFLAAASPVFYKMFTTDMKESRTNTCKLDATIDPAIFGHLMRFIYGGLLPIFTCNLAMKLYNIAHIYQVEPLKRICENEMPKFLEVTNVFELYKLAHRYELEDLKIKAWRIIKR